MQLDQCLVTRAQKMLKLSRYQIIELPTRRINAISQWIEDLLIVS